MIQQLTTSSSSLQILIIDNDQNAVDGYRQALVDRGFIVRTAANVEKAFRQVARYGAPNLIIVADQIENDVSITTISADEVAQRFLQRYNNMPFIVLLNTMDQDRAVRYLTNWSDDCIVKPVNPAVIAARTQRILNRIENRHDVGQYVTEADQYLTIDFLNKKAYLHDTRVNLTHLETKLLHILLLNNGNTVTKEFIMRRLWPNDHAPDERLYTYVSRLRNKLRVNPEVPNYIVLNPGIGYQFVRAEC